MNVLIIEQDEKTAEDIASYLAKADVNPVIARNVIAAHNVIGEKTPEWIVCNGGFFNVPLQTLVYHLREHDYRAPLCFYRYPVTDKTNTAAHWKSFNAWLFEDERYRKIFESLFALLEAFFPPPKELHEVHPQGGGALKQDGTLPIKIGEAFIDFNKNVILRNGITTRITPRIQEILAFFCAHPNHSFSISQIEFALWGKTDGDKARNIYVYINVLRKLLEKDPKNPKVIIRDSKGRYLFHY